MATYYNFVKMIAKDVESRDKLVEIMSTAIAKHKDDPEILTFAICLPHEDQGGLMKGDVDPLTVLNIEGYKDKATKQRLRDGEEGAAIFAQVQPLISGAERKIMNASFQFMRPTLAEAADPYIILAKFGYQPGTIDQALDGWRELLEYGEKAEPPTLGYSCFKDGDDLRTLEIYSERDFVYQVHARSDAIKKNGAQNGHWRTGNNVADKYHKVAGFLAR